MANLENWSPYYTFKHKTLFKMWKTITSKWHIFVILFNKIRTLNSKLLSHAYYLMNDLDPIKNNDHLTQLAYGINSKHGRINRQFIIPLIIVICTITIGIFGIDGNGSWGLISFKWERMVTHFFFSKKIWKHSDFVFLMGTLALLVSFLYLLLTPRLDQRVCMQVIWNSQDKKPCLIDSRYKPISPNIANQIYERRRVIRQIIKWVYFSWIICVWGTFTQQMLANNIFIWYPHIIVYWIVMAPITVNYLNYGKYIF